MDRNNVVELVGREHRPGAGQHWVMHIAVEELEKYKGEGWSYMGPAKPYGMRSISCWVERYDAKSPPSSESSPSESASDG